MSNIAVPKTAEDYILFLTPIVAAAAGFNWSGLIPGSSGFLVGVFVGALAKTLIGLGQNIKSWEDWLAAIILGLGFVSTALLAPGNPQYLTWGTIIGLFVKALGYFTDTKSNPIEDVVLAIGTIMAGYGAYIGNSELLNAGLLFGLIGKSMPSIGTGGAAGSPAPGPAPASAPAPPPTAAGT